MLKSRITGMLLLSFLANGLLMHLAPEAVAATGFSSREKRQQALAANYERNTIPIEFYGMVEDLDGNPVPDAEVIMRLTWLPPTPMLDDQKLIRRTTDHAGRFRIEATGYQLYLVEIVKDGYQYHFKYNRTNRGLRFSKGNKQRALGEFPEQPVVFKVRKKGPPTLVLTGHASFQLRPGQGSNWVVDLVGNRWSEPEYVRYKKMIFKDWHSDLQISLDKEDGVYRLVFNALDENTGLAMGEPEQYEAPEAGYQQELVLEIPETEATSQRWLFVEGRGGVFYSMLQVETHPSKRWVNVRIGYGTNPNGSRNLEPNADLQAEYIRNKYGRGGP